MFASKSMFHVIPIAVRNCVIKETCHVIGSRQHDNEIQVSISQTTSHTSKRLHPS